ncbi:CPBP family intramembrane metalloprotease [Chloroflexota bacterium]|nr:CPBP family intramembrane metalloprotease [Chloroflexota bacterium]
MHKKTQWSRQETIALIWIVAAMVIAIAVSLWRGFPFPIFTLIFLLPPLIKLLVTKDAKRIGMGSMAWQTYLKWTAINLGILAAIYLIFEPLSGAYRFLVEEATQPTTQDPTFFWIPTFNSPTNWIGLVFYSGLVSLFAEELCFRGWLLRGLTTKLGAGWANIIQAAIFTLPQLVITFLMPNPLMSVVYGLIYSFVAIGLVNGMVANQSGNIWPNLTAAVVINFILTLFLI